MPGNLDLALRVRAELGQAITRLKQLEAELEDTAGAARGAGRGARTAADGVDRIDDAAGRARRGLTRLDVGLAAFAANIASGALARAVDELAQLPGAIVESGLAIERLENRFRFAAGGITESAREIAFVRIEADRLGIDFTAAADAYSGLAAAARGTSLSVADTREIFLSVAEAARVMGLSSDQTSGALLALEQIISKGKVTAEELRGQLGERLPGALQIMARALGVTTAELDKMLEQGEVGSDALILFARSLRESVADDVPAATRQAAAEFERLGNAIERLQGSVARSGLLQFLARVAQNLTEIIDLASGYGSIEERIARTLAARRNDENALLQIYQEAGAELTRIYAEHDALAARVNALDTLPGLDGLVGTDDLERLAELRRRAEVLREALAQVATRLNEVRSGAGAPAGDPPIPGAPAGDPPIPGAPSTGGRAAERAAEAAARRLTAIEARETEARLRITEDRIAQSLRAERRLLDDIARLAPIAGASAEDVERARTAVVERGIADRDRILSEQLERDAERERRRAETLAQGRSDLAALERDLLGPYDRAVAEANAWRAETEAAFAAAGLAAEEYARVTEQVALGRIAAAWEAEAARRVRATDDWRAGAARALREYQSAAITAAEAAERAVTRGLGAMEDALVQFVTTGKLGFGDLVNSIISDLARLAIQRSITGPLANALFGAFGGAGGGLSFPSGSLGHTGGIAGSLTRSRTGVDPRAFAFAPRLHAGGIAGALRPDEVPAILRRGEGVFTPEQMRALGSLSGPREVRVELVNRGQPQAVEEVTASVDIRGEVIRIVTRDIADGGEVARSIQSIVPGTVL